MRAPGSSGATIWASGVATAAVAATVAVTGVVVCEGVVGLRLPSSAGRGASYWSTAGRYAVVAALFALLATAVLQLLTLGVPRPVTFFGWFLGAAGVIATAWPFTTDAKVPAELATAAIGILVVVAVWSLLTAARRRAVGSRSTEQQP